MTMSEIDSFFFKYKNLLIAGKSANLTLRAEAGKATITLAVEVEDLQHVHPNNRPRDGPSRQRRREKRAKARSEEAELAGNEADPTEVNESTDKETETVSEHEANTKKTDAAEASTNGNEPVKALQHEPLDEIENAVISKETKVQEANDFTNVLSVIPLKNFNSSDDVLQKAISGKVLARHFKVKEIEIHRSVRGTFVRGDVLIEPASGELIKRTDFGFENCQVVPHYGFL